MKADKFAIVAAFAASLLRRRGFCARIAQTQPQPKAAELAGVQQRQNPQHQNAPQQSQPEDAVNAMIGAWEFSNADHDKICHFTFRAEAAPGGRQLDVDKNCPNLFPSTKNISRLGGRQLRRFAPARCQGEAVIELTQVESGMYDGFTPEEGRYILQTAAAAPMRSAEDMVGDWAIARGPGKPICALTLANSPAGRRRLGAASVKPGCDPVGHAL